MGIKNMRAICPNCGGKIHTQPKGLLGAVAFGANGKMVQTGKQCEHCGIKLTGEVTYKNYAVAAKDRSGPPGETREEYLQRMNSERWRS